MLQEVELEVDVVVHAPDITALKSIVEPQLSPEDWHGDQETWNQWESVVKSIKEGRIATAAILLSRTSAKEAVSRKSSDIDPTRPLLLGASGSFHLEAWIPTSLAATIGKKPLRVNGTDNDGTPVTIPGDAFLSYLEQQQAQGGGQADRDIKTIAVFDQKVFDPRTSADASIPEIYSLPHIPKLGLGPQSRLSRLLERMDPSLRQDTRWLLLGPARSGTAIHTDPQNTNAWNTVCYGRKHWAILSPDVASELAFRDTSPEGMEWTLPEWFSEEWPSIASDAISAGGEAFETVQEAGETIYIPSGWWHAVMNVESSTAVTENFVRAETLQVAIDECWQQRKLLEKQEQIRVSQPPPQNMTGEVHELEKKYYAEVTAAILNLLSLVDDELVEGEGGSGIYRWLLEMHDDGILNLMPPS